MLMLDDDVDGGLVQAVSDIIRTTLGPRAMLKMLLDASGGKYHAALHRALLYEMSFSDS